MKYTDLGFFSVPAPRVDPVIEPNGECHGFFRVDQDPARVFFYASHRLGVVLAPNHRMITDFGSIPRVLQGLPRLDRTTYLPSYIGHDFLYWFRYVLRLPPEGLDPWRLSVLHRGVFELDDDARVTIYEEAFEVVPCGRLYCDGLLSEMMTVQTYGDARWQRKVVRSGLFVGGWAAWLGKQRRKGSTVR